MTDNLDSPKTGATAGYMTESYITEDGLVVPPPTREMGPRRLTRYRVEAADFLRALRDGGELPEEPIEFMGSLPEGEIGSETRKIYDRFNTLLEEGIFEAEGASAQGTTDGMVIIENEEIITSDDLLEIDTVHQEAVNLAEEEIITSDDLLNLNSAVEVVEPDGEEKATEVEDSSVFEVEDSVTVASEEKAVEEPLLDFSAAPVEEEIKPVEDTPVKVTPNRFDLIRAKAAKARAVSSVSSALPEPVNALDSQGIDFEPLNRAEERAEETRRAEKTEEKVAPVVVEEGPASLIEVPLQEPMSEVTLPEQIAVPAPDPIIEEEPEPRQSFSVAEAVTQKSQVPEQKRLLNTAEREATYAPSSLTEKKRTSATWIGLMSIVAIIILIFVWLIFFK